MKKEADWRTSLPEEAAAGFPFSVPPAFSALIARAESCGGHAAAEALRRQVFPSKAENAVSPEECSDPLGEAGYCVLPRLVHQYKNRVLLLSTGCCLGYCRYCFRRALGTSRTGFLSADETPEVLRYLTEHTEVEEVLVSGGDPFSAPFPEVAALLEQIRRIRPSLLIRLCTRAPIFAPELFSAEKTGVLRGFRPLWLIPHINHPAELGPAQRECLTSFVDAGIPVQSQTVLLRGVNDCAETLHGLFHALVCLGVKPGYLFQCDLAPGTAHFRVPLARAAALWKELRAGLSGLSLPKFAVDLPGGGGKFPLEAAVFAADIESFSADGLTVRKKSGGTYTYPG